MKALTVWPEWAWAIVHAGKNVENRTWAPGQMLLSSESIWVHGRARA